MKQREMKFRVWDIKKKKYLSHRLGEIISIFPVNPKRYIVEQYIGRQDCNNKDIYEGDLLISELIFLFENEDIKYKPAIVQYNNKLACFILRKDDIMVVLSTILIGWNSSVFEIIGNINENPELYK